MKELRNCHLELISTAQSLSKELSGAKDLSDKFEYNFDDSISENIKLIDRVKRRVNQKPSDFEAKIQNELQRTNWLEFKLREEISLRSVKEFQDKSNKLRNKVKEDNWSKKELIFNNNTLEFFSNVELFIQKKEEYFQFQSEEDSLFVELNWLQFYNDLSTNYQHIIDKLKSKTDWRRSFMVYYLESILHKFASNNELPANEDELVELDKALCGIKDEQPRYIMSYWTSKQIDAKNLFPERHSGLVVENIYNKRSSKGHPRHSLRGIVQYDVDFFTTFFPIILTSPDVCCNIFEFKTTKNKYFDIVMFDEASQLRLEDNLPATLKGKQIVIAGDEHQMPPSNYFSKVFDGSVEEEDDIEEEEAISSSTVNKDLLSCESLLDFAVELGFEKRYLDFHYRSEHPYLIDFSNHAFYNQRLKSLLNKSNYIPINYIQVNGTFSDHSNEAEAETVLSIIENNINRFPDGKFPTVGIATFNITQRDLIQRKILERKKLSEFEEFNRKAQELEENGMFIKNLENIQGDEKDVIILSTIYGLNKDGKFHQRFGPINQQKGYKLLNVIITRAKYKIYVCSSVPEQCFMGYKDHLAIEGSNNKKAVFFAYLAYCKAVSECSGEARSAVLTALSEYAPKGSLPNIDAYSQLESPFEEEVYQVLVDEFGEDRLTPQYQFAGFRIDIVFESKKANVPKIAIECDGAKYHSSHEAYVYDRHRQRILEKHGFLFHRIWSTNWFRNLQRESKKLIEFIKKTEEQSHQLTNYTKIFLAFTDFTNNVRPSIPFDADKEAIAFKAIQGEEKTPRPSKR